MSRLLLIMAVAILILSLILSGCVGAASPPATAAKNYELKIAIGAPSGHPLALTWQNWVKDIEAATNGRVTAKIYNSGTLIPDAQIHDALVSGVVDCGSFIPAFTPGVFNVLEGFELPGNGPSSGVSGSLAMWEAYKSTPAAQTEASDLKVLWLACSGSAHIGTVDQPIRTLADINGLEIRGAGITLDALNALGAVGVSIPMPDTYSNLKKKIVRGAVNPFDSIKSERFADFYQYYTICYIYSAYRFYEGMSLKTWNSLPPDLQKIIADVSDGYALKTGQYFDAANELGYEECLAKNIEIIRLSEAETIQWRNRWAPMRDKWVADMTARGLPGQDLLKMADSLLAKYYPLYPDPVGLHMPE